MQRRTLLRSSLLGTGAAIAGWHQARAEGAATNPGLSAGTREEAVFDTLPGKRPLIKLSYRPPNYESPLSAFAGPITANDQFFVRYHLSQMPDRATLARWSLTIGGDAAGKSLSLRMDDLQRLPQQEVVAVCQCSGNRRGLSSPHVAGVQWGVGAMGCAVWRGPRLRDVLALAGITASAKEIAFHGTDGPVMEATPAFVKSIPLDRAQDDNTIIALRMNDAELPIWNGYPARIIVPGWTATYWMKHVTNIEIRATKLDNFWMKSAYRVPTGLFPGSPFPTQDNDTNRPITDILVNALATSHADGASVRGPGFTLSGLAWDNGSGTDKVEVSITDGETWGRAMLGPLEGRFAFRPWFIQLAASPGPFAVRIRATAKSGAVQPAKPVFNPAGYHHNAIQTLHLIAS
jgi:sulfite dehydrogenase